MIFSATLSPFCQSGPHFGLCVNGGGLERVWNGRQTGVGFLLSLTGGTSSVGLASWRAVHASGPCGRCLTFEYGHDQKSPSGLFFLLRGGGRRESQSRRVSLSEDLFLVLIGFSLKM